MAGSGEPAGGEDRVGGRARERAGLHRPFHPRRARVVAVVVGLAAFVGLTALGLSVPDYGVADRAAFVAVGVLIAAFAARQAMVRALADEQGLTVRNLVLSRRMEWAEVLSVRFGGGQPWAQLDLSDGSVLAVMAVQRADGAFAEQEAGRLATLVELHAAPEPPGR